MPVFIEGLTRFEWDEAKRLSNIEKHGIDFVDVTATFFDDQSLVYQSPVLSVEPRSVLIGEAHGRVIAVIFTVRDGVVRLISARRARRIECEQWARSEPFD